MKIGPKDKKISSLNGVNTNDLILMLVQIKYIEMRIRDTVDSIKLGSWIRVFRVLAIAEGLPRSWLSGGEESTLK